MKLLWVFILFMLCIAEEDRKLFWHISRSSLDSPFILLLSKPDNLIKVPLHASFSIFYDFKWRLLINFKHSRNSTLTQLSPPEIALTKKLFPSSVKKLNFFLQKKFSYSFQNLTIYHPVSLLLSDIQRTTPFPLCS